MAGEAIVTTLEKYVLVTLKGDALSAVDIKSTIIKAIEEAMKADLDIMVHRDRPAKQTASVFDFYNFAEFISQSSFRKKLAMVYPKETQHDNIDFFATASKNRGVSIALFSTIEEAHNWFGVSENMELSNK